ncbi:MAG TPA: DUF1080 domain-containing protein [Phycisphaerales bacterium]|nr:DUF1080 domain-containing protein [Phycisphaerales bacterium]
MHKLYLFGLMSCLVVCTGISVQASSSVDQRLEELLSAPLPQTFQDAQAQCAALFELGSEAIVSLCQMLDAVEDDTRQRTLLQTAAAYVGQDGRLAERTLFIQAIAQSLEQTSDKETQAFLIELLQWAGDDRSIAVLSGFLTDGRLCGPAARALTTLGTPAAAHALTTALNRPQIADKSAVILALGTLRVEQAAETLAPYSRDADAALRHSAQWALANIGYEPAATAIFETMTAASGYPKAQAASHYALLARRLAQKGQADTAAAMCRKILADRDTAIAASIQADALDALVTAAGAAALADLITAAGSDNRSLQVAAVNLADRIDGPDATERWIRLLAEADAFLAEHIAAMLGRRGDRSALLSVLELLYHADDSVAASAMTAAVQLDEDKAVEAIVAMLRETDRPQRIAEGVDVLMRLPGQKALRAAAQSLVAMPPTSRIKVMEGLAGRRAAEYSSYILEQAVAADPTVRRAAIRALMFCAAADDLPTLLSLMLDTDDRTEQAGLQRAAVAAAQQLADIEKRADPILERLSQADDSDKAVLIRTLGQVGGTEALKTVRGYADSDDSDIKDAAIRALADWPDVSAVEGLMEVVRTEELRYQVIALRSALRLVQNSRWTSRQKVQLAKQALEAVSREGEKQLILSFLSQVKSNRALTLAAHYLDDSALRPAAAAAVARIALPDGDHKGLDGVYVANVLTESVDALTDEQLQQQVRDYLNTLPPPSKPQTKTPPDGFSALFNNQDLTGWQGVLLAPYDNPIRRARLSDSQRADLQAKADDLMKKHWHVKDGILYFDGGGFSLSTIEDYRDFELYVDWKIAPHGDSGIYLRGAPQVQIWDPADWPEGSGGLYNNQKNPSKPLVRADHPIGQWNTFFIRMIDQHVTVYLNDTLIVDNVVLENYWDRRRPIFAAGPIELQCHGDPVWFNNIFVRRIRPQETGGVRLFNGRDLSGWVGDTAGYVVQDEAIVWQGGGNLYTEQEYGDFHFQCEFRLTPGANNGIGIRSPRQGNPAYDGMEIQILDDTADRYADLQPYQYCGSIYGVAPAQRGRLKPVGQWNAMDIIADGPRITVILNDVIIVDTDLTQAIEQGTMDGRDHPGLTRTGGHIVIMGHGTEVAFRNMQIKEL